MNNSHSKNPILIFVICLITFILAYYTCILLHEWGHGTAAWWFGQKSNPFDIYYGGWALLHVDENVDYESLILVGQGTHAAIIGASGVSVSIFTLLISFLMVRCPNIQKSTFLFTFFYFSLALSVVPLLQYFILTTFSTEGDIGRFITGLNISPWWVFIPGTIFVMFILWEIFKKEVPRAYAVIPIKSLWERRLFLFFTLAIIFLFIYSHGYNPLTDQGTTLISKVMAVISILLVPVIFIICDPSRKWVKKALS